MNNLLQEKAPEIAEQWDFYKNDTENLNTITCFSNKKVWWRCKNNHSWQAMVSSRMRGNGCPFCVGKFGCLLVEKYPNLQEEWDFEKNDGINIQKITCGSNKRVWWKCKQGHNWQAIIANRAYGSKCPICFGRTGILLKEKYPELIKQFDYDRNKDIDANTITFGSNKRVWWRCEKEHSWQANVSNRVHGNGCPICYGRNKDFLKDKYPEIFLQWDYQKNKEIDVNSITTGSGKIVWWKCKNNHSWKAKVNTRTSGHGCPFCAGRTKELFKDKNPELLNQWDHKKNINVNLNTITFGSRKKAWWKCIKGHSWQASISSRCHGSGCPFCVGKAQELLIHNFPELVKEWDYDKNKDVDITKTTHKSNKKVWWLCSKKHSWQAFVFNRTFGSGCPFCARKNKENAG